MLPIMNKTLLQKLAFRTTIHSQKISKWNTRLQHTLARSHYQVLGITPLASKKEIKEAYLNLSKKHHPDTLMGPSLRDDEDEEEYVKIREAYDVLSDNLRKHNYDVLNNFKDERLNYARTTRSRRSRRLNSNEQILVVQKYDKWGLTDEQRERHRYLEYKEGTVGARLEWVMGFDLLRFMSITSVITCFYLMQLFAICLIYKTASTATTAAKSPQKQ